MGGRRKSNKMQKKEKPLAVRTQFDCRICGYQNCINKCNLMWDCKVRAMDENIDVYHKWIQYLSTQKRKPIPVPQTHFQDEESKSIEDIDQMVKAKQKTKLDDSMDLSEESIQLSQEINNNKEDKLQLKKIKTKIDQENSAEQIKQENYIPRASPERQPLISSEDDENSFESDDEDEYNDNITKKIKAE